MSDWIPVPEFENVLIVLAELADAPEDIADAPAFPLLDRLKQWNGGTVYVFHSPPEAGEVLEDLDPDMAARFALAAQMSDMPAEVVRDAFRRVFSRSVVQRVLLVASQTGRAELEKIDELFAKLEHHDLVWAGEWPTDFALGMKQFQGEIFSDLNNAQNDLRKIVREIATEKNLGIFESEDF